MAGSEVALALCVPRSNVHHNLHADYGSNGVLTLKVDSIQHSLSN